MLFPGISTADQGRAALPSLTCRAGHAPRRSPASPLRWAGATPGMSAVVPTRTASGMLAVAVTRGCVRSVWKKKTRRITTMRAARRWTARMPVPHAAQSDRTSGTPALHSSAAELAGHYRRPSRRSTVSSSSPISRSRSACAAPFPRRLRAARNGSEHGGPGPPTGHTDRLRGAYRSRTFGARAVWSHDRRGTWPGRGSGPAAAACIGRARSAPEATTPPLASQAAWWPGWDGSLAAKASTGFLLPARQVEPHADHEISRAPEVKKHVPGLPSESCAPRGTPRRKPWVQRLRCGSFRLTLATDTKPAGWCITQRVCCAKVVDDTGLEPVTPGM